MNAEQLEAKLHKEIPLSAFMQVKVISADEDSVELECPLGPNHNHLGTAFGGSLSCLMILTAYCQIFKLIDPRGHVLLKSGAMDFFLPVEEKLKAHCKLPSAEEVESFLKSYQKRGRGRLHLESFIMLSDGRIACSMKTEFVGIT